MPRSATSPPPVPRSSATSAGTGSRRSASRGGDGYRGRGGLGLAGKLDSQLADPVDPERRFVTGLLGEAHAAHTRGEERKRLLQLGPREAGAEAEVGAGAEGERLRPPAVGADVKGGGVLACVGVAVRCHRGGEDQAARRE